jgi:6-phosphofructokinase 1
MDLSNVDWAPALREGGTILGSTRLHPHKRQQDREQAVDAVKDLDGLIVIGGDGSLRSAAKLQAHISTARPEFVTCGVPKTIDNDVAATEASIGFASAVQRAQEACDAASTTARSHRRVVVVEVMGRHSGALAAAVALTGSAQFAVLPEIHHDEQRFVAWAASNPGSVVVVAEGATLLGGQSHYYDDEGWIKPGFPSAMLVESLAAHDVEARAVVLGHLLRGGAPAAADRELGASLGVTAALAALQGRSSLAVSRSGQVIAVPLSEALQPSSPLHPHVIERLRQLSLY